MLQIGFTAPHQQPLFNSSSSSSSDFLAGCKSGSVSLPPTGQTPSRLHDSIKENYSCCIYIQKWNFTIAPATHGCVTLMCPCKQNWELRRRIAGPGGHLVSGNSHSKFTFLSQGNSVVITDNKMKSKLASLDLCCFKLFPFSRVLQELYYGFSFSLCLFDSLWFLSTSCTSQQRQKVLTSESHVCYWAGFSTPFYTCEGDAASFHPAQPPNSSSSPLVPQRCFARFQPRVLSAFLFELSQFVAHETVRPIVVSVLWLETGHVRVQKKTLRITNTFVKWSNYRHFALFFTDRTSYGGQIIVQIQ